MARKLLIALVILAALAGGAVFFLRTQLRAASPAPPELARVADPTSQRRLPSGGEVVGYAGRYGSHVWLGIPYAEPPVGERRWRAPAPPAAWSGAREALAFGAHCPQFASMFGGVADVPFGSLSGSEDCLFLNVYAPRMDAAAAAQARLPVMVWIHGGGNTIGLSDFFDGGRLAQEPERGGGDAQLPAGSPRLVPPRGAARRRVARRAVGQLRDARPGARARVGARERGRLRRRSRQRHHLRRVRRRAERVHPAALAARERALPARHRAERRHRTRRRSPRPRTSRDARRAGAAPTPRTRCSRACWWRTARRATRLRRGRRSRRCPQRSVAGFLRSRTPEQLLAGYHARERRGHVRDAAGLRRRRRAAGGRSALRFWRGPTAGTACR